MFCVPSERIRPVLPPILVFGLLLTRAAFGGETWSVQSGGCGSERCYAPVTMENINAAIAEASCGDTIVIEAGATASIMTPGQALKYAKACAAGNELVVTTSKADWLPDARDRVLPSYRS